MQDLAIQTHNGVTTSWPGLPLPGKGGRTGGEGALSQGRGLGRVALGRSPHEMCSVGRQHPRHPLSGALATSAPCPVPPPLMPIPHIPRSRFLSFLLFLGCTSSLTCRVTVGGQDSAVLWSAECGPPLLCGSIVENEPAATFVFSWPCSVAAADNLGGQSPGVGRGVVGDEPHGAHHKAGTSEWCPKLVAGIGRSVWSKSGGHLGTEPWRNSGTKGFSLTSVCLGHRDPLFLKRQPISY